MNLLTSDFSFEYPREQIAQHPLPIRDASRMMILNRESQTIRDALFSDFPNLLNPGDLVVLNNTRVLPARVFAKRESSSGKVEILFLHRASQAPDQNLAENIWACFLDPARGFSPGSKLYFETNPQIEAEVIEKSDRYFLISFSADVSVPDLLINIGHPPLPPYIRHGRAELSDRERYQTVFAENIGSVAAPTAGLHFTDRIFAELKNRKIEVARLTLHVGLGTFSPIRSELLSEHLMHEEMYQVSETLVRAVLNAKKEGQRILAVGTSCVRALESYFSSLDPDLVISEKIFEDFLARTNKLQSTSLFIMPGHRFRVVDRFFTNFHQPRSTPLVLTAAFAGWDFLKKAYEEAIRLNYRLFSYGDGMWIG